MKTRTRVWPFGEEAVGFLPEGGEVVEIVIEAHEDERSGREDELAETESETGAGAERSRHALHPISLLFLFIIQTRISKNSAHFTGEIGREKNEKHRTKKAKAHTCNANWTLFFLFICSLLLLMVLVLQIN